jgi:hypothetical protein
VLYRKKGIFFKIQILMFTFFGSVVLNSSNEEKKTRVGYEPIVAMCSLLNVETGGHLGMPRQSAAELS